MSTFFVNFYRAILGKDSVVGITRSFFCPPLTLVVDLPRATLLTDVVIGVSVASTVPDTAQTRHKYETVIEVKSVGEAPVLADAHRASS